MVLGGISSSNYEGSIGNEVVVTGSRGPILPNKPFQVREGLRNRETPLGGRQLLPEYLKRDLVGGARLLRQGRRVVVQPDPVVLDQLARTLGRVVDRLAVSRIDDAR